MFLLNCIYLFHNYIFLILLLPLQIDDYNYLKKKSYIQKNENLSNFENSNDEEVIVENVEFYRSEHHFLYNKSYRVPCVFFNIYNKG